MYMSFFSTLSNACLPGSSPTDNEAHQALVTLLQYLNLCSLDDRCKDVLFVRMYKIANEKVDIT